MKKSKKGADELRSEYKRSDFKSVVRGKYHARVTKSSNVVVLDDELAEVFPNSASVNRALHSLVEVAKKSSGHATASSGRSSQRLARR
jgi:hypothetical protein